MKLVVLAIVLTSAIYSCTSGVSNSDKKVKANNLNRSTDIMPFKVLGSEQDGFGADVKLSIVQIISSGEKVTYKAVSSYKGKNIGFEISLPKEDAGDKNYPVNIFTIKSMGDISDSFLSTLTALYKLKAANNKKLIDSLQGDAFDLEKFAKSLPKGETTNLTNRRELKLFFHDNNPDDDAEIYLVISEKEHWLELKEKDDGYRDLIIKYLTKK